MSKKNENTKEHLKSLVKKACEQLNPNFVCDDILTEDIETVCENFAKRVKKCGMSIGDNGFVTLSLLGLSLTVDSINFSDSSDAALRLFYRLVDCDKTNVSGVTILHKVVIADFARGLEMLLKRNVNVNQKTIDKDLTPLHCVRSAECAALLLKHGADPKIKNANNNTLLSQIFKGLRNYRDEEKNMIKILLKSENLVEVVDVFYKNNINFYEINTARHEHLKPIVYDAGVTSFRQLADLSKIEPPPLAITHPLYKYVQEIKLLCNTKILHMSLFDFLVKEKRELSVSLRNPEIFNEINEILNGKKKQLYPEYSKYLVNNFTVARKRMQLEKEAGRALISLLPKLQMHHVIVEKILQCLTDKDLKNVINC